MKTGKVDISWVKEQSKQLEIEIEAVKNIRYQNVLKLYAYNLNARYPVNSNVSQTEPKYIDTVLLVNEWVPGGELFDIFHHRSNLRENVIRTLFGQMIRGLEACHNANVVVREWKPQNLLLDAKCNLKITDVGLSKIMVSDADLIMKTTYVGNRGVFF